MRFSFRGMLTLTAMLAFALPTTGQTIANQGQGISQSSQNAHVIGSTDDVWEKVEIDGRSILVKMNAKFVSTSRVSGHAYQSADGKVSEGWNSIKERQVDVFDTYIVANLPESDIVGAPQSIMHEVEGNCEIRHYIVMGSLYFSGKNRGGVAMQSLPPEDVERRLVPNSPFEKAFDMLCKKASESRELREQQSMPAGATRDYAGAKAKFQAMGLCITCADNVAQWYVEQPTSSCGQLADHALRAEPDAIQLLKTFPSYCRWNYK